MNNIPGINYPSSMDLELNPQQQCIPTPKYGQNPVICFLKIGYDFSMGIKEQACLSFQSFLPRALKIYFRGSLSRQNGFWNSARNEKCFRRGRRMGVQSPIVLPKSLVVMLHSIHYHMISQREGKRKKKKNKHANRAKESQFDNCFNRMEEEGGYM